MIVEFNFNENDFVTYQTYNLQKSFQYRKSKIINGFLLPMICIISGVVLLNTTYQLFASVFLILGVGLLFIKPYVEKKSYLEHFRKWYRENFHQSTRKISLKIDDNFISETDIKKKKETKFCKSELESITEISSHIFIKFQNNVGFIVPKSEIKELDLLKQALQNIADSYHLQYTYDNKWSF